MYRWRVMPDRSETADEQVVRRAFQRFGARDAEGLVALMHADGEIYPYAIDERRGEGYRGHDGVRRYVADVTGIFESFNVDIDELRDVGDGVVLADGRIRGKTLDGMEIDMAAAWLWTVREGRVARMEAHPAHGTRPGG
jgi:ketosteroid isomerase-like protein